MPFGEKEMVLILKEKKVKSRYERIYIYLFVCLTYELLCRIIITITAIRFNKLKYQIHLINFRIIVSNSQHIKINVTKRD